MCTTVIVGRQASATGSLLVARSADSASVKAQHYVIHEAVDQPGRIYRCADHGGVNNFEYALPNQTLRYTSVPFWKTQLHGAVGFNEAGLGVSATESIFARDDVLAVDPYNKESGITEDDIVDLVLACCHSAREAVQFLGRIIETQGAGEGFGVAFVDTQEIWYLETGSGHQWLAQRLPDDVYFASANQGRLRQYNPLDDNMMASATLVSFATAHGFYNPELDARFDFASVYTRDDQRDRIYNDPRVWEIQKCLTPAVVQAPDDGRHFPVFLPPEKPITAQDLMRMMRLHFEGTEHNPYEPTLRGEEPWRPVSVFRTYEAHVMEVRPWLPKAIGEVTYLAMGMADLSVFVPFYAGLKFVPGPYSCGIDQSDMNSAYWLFRNVQTLAMTDYTRLAPLVKAAYKAYEDALPAKMSEMETQYLALINDEAYDQAQELLDDFNHNLIHEALNVARKVLDELFTVAAAHIEERVVFKNNKSKD